jgi:two-component system chemotaxis response regulator CheB
MDNIDKDSGKVTSIVAIGTSTGGPKALQEVVPLIPENIMATFLIVQHMPAGFTKSLADRLNAMSNVKVKEAEHNEILKNAYVYIAPGDYHMKILKESDSIFRINLTKDPPISGLRPSVNIMMESVADTEIKKVVGVIMTGMGGDGSEGVKKLKQKNNAYIIAQDESSSVVFGMPKVAIQTGAVDIVVPLKEITNEIIRIVGVHNNGYESIP